MGVYGLTCSRYHPRGGEDLMELKLCVIMANSCLHVWILPKSPGKEMKLCEREVLCHIHLEPRKGS